MSSLLLKLFFLFLFISPTFAGFQQIEIRNLYFHYVYPLGEGELEKLKLGMSLTGESYPIGVVRTENSFVVSSSLVDFEWINPFTFIHNIQEAKITKLNGLFGKGGHGASAEHVSLVPEKLGEISIDGLKVNCLGNSNHTDLENRILLDCFQKMRLDIAKLGLPFDFFSPLLADVDYQPDSGDEIPTGDFSFLNSEGNFQTALRVKFLISAYVRAWGFVQFDAVTNTFGIRIDQIKYGILPITDLVMRELERRVKHPSITINPPWIYIKSKSSK
jgi:hypothetical protein